MNHIELKLGRDMQTVLMEAQDSMEGDTSLQDAIEIVLNKIVYPMIDRNIE